MDDNNQQNDGMRLIKNVAFYDTPKAREDAGEVDVSPPYVPTEKEWESIYMGAWEAKIIAGGAMIMGALALLLELVEILRH
jgi:hypothetical protein